VGSSFHTALCELVALYSSIVTAIRGTCRVAYNSSYFLPSFDDAIEAT
jgi:hypothetical protein